MLRKLTFCCGCCKQLFPQWGWGNRVETGPGKHSTTQRVHNVSASRKAASRCSLLPPRCDRVLTFSFTAAQQWRSNWSARKRVRWKVTMETAPPTAFTIQRLLQAFMYNKLAKKDFQTHSPDFECSWKVLRGMKNACGFQWEITRQRILFSSSFCGDNLWRH